MSRKVLTSLDVDGDLSVKFLTATAGATFSDQAVTGVPDPVTLTGAANKRYVDNAISGVTASAVPTGCMMMWPTATPPAGWLLCNGQSTTGFPALAALVGATVPDLRGRFPLGVGTTQPSGTVVAVGTTGGVDQRSLVAGNLPPHTHPIPRADGVGTSGTTHARGSTTGVGDGTAGNNVNHTSTPFGILPPYGAVNFIIKT